MKYILPDGRVVEHGESFFFTNEHGLPEKFGGGDYLNPAKIAESGLVLAQEEVVHEFYIPGMPAVDYQAGTISYPGKAYDFQAAQAGVYARIKARRKAVEERGFVHDGALYVLDLKGELRLTNLAEEFAAAPESIQEWQAQDPVTGQDMLVVITAAAYAEIKEAGHQHIKAAFARQFALAAALSQAVAAQSIAGVAAVVDEIETGWPGE